MFIVENLTSFPNKNMESFSMMILRKAEAPRILRGRFFGGSQFFAAVDMLSIRAYMGGRTPLIAIIGAMFIYLYEATKLG